jgi:hypothetical protein
MERFAGIVDIIDDDKVIDSALGGSDGGEAILRIWWD